MDGVDETGVGCFAWTISGRLIITVHGHRAPSVADWDAHLTEMRKIRNPGVCRVIVYTIGGVPDTAQQRQLTASLQGMPMPVAVLTSNVFIRTTIQVASWFRPQVKAFADTQTEAAFVYLGLRDEEKARSLDLLHELARDIAIVPPGGVTRSTSAA